jgi:LPS export ABC transporter protein LptC
MGRLREYIPVVFWCVVVIAASVAAWMIVVSRELISEEHITTSNPKIDEVPPAVADEPLFEEVSADGTVRWTLYLDKVIREEGGVMELSNPRALYRLESGETLQVTGDSGTYDEDNGILTLEGNVTGMARESDFGFSVDKMTWDGNQGILDATGGVEVTREGISFTGQELRLTLSEELTRMTITGGVNITTAPSALEELAQTGQ